MTTIVSPWRRLKTGNELKPRKTEIIA